MTDALGDRGTHLQAVLAVLTDDVTDAVPSFLGLTVTLHLDGCPITMTANDGDLAAAGASLHLPLGPVAGVVFYAGHAGAFVDLAADAYHADSVNGQVVLDGHLIPTTGHPGPGFSGLVEQTVINQAVGVLIEQGYLAGQARDELLRRAAHQGHGLLAAAADLLNRDCPR